MTEVTLAHTADLDAATLRAGRRLLYDVFDDMTDDDWEHALGGIHALAWDGVDLIGHASVVQRRLIHAGRALRAGYVEGVAVRADRRERGLGGAMMTALEGVIRRAYDLGALGATDEAAHFYAARGWQLWQGPTSALTPSGVRRTADDDGAVFVLPLSIPLSLDGDSSATGATAIPGSGVFLAFRVPLARLVGGRRQIPQGVLPPPHVPP
jgi:aminoglycoside 2'-N-acetyltransferase I